MGIEKMQSEDFQPYVPSLIDATEMDIADGEPLCGEPQHHFYCPADPGATNRTTGSAYWTLVNSLHWTIVEYGAGQ